MVSHKPDTIPATAGYVTTRIFLTSVLHPGHPIGIRKARKCRKIRQVKQWFRRLRNNYWLDHRRYLKYYWVIIYWVFFPRTITSDFFVCSNPLFSVHSNVDTVQVSLRTLVSLVITVLPPETINICIPPLTLICFFFINFRIFYSLLIRYTCCWRTVERIRNRSTGENGNPRLLFLLLPNPSSA